MFLADDCADVAEPGAARSLSAPKRDGSSAAQACHTALQQSRDSGRSSPGAVTHRRMRILYNLVKHAAKIHETAYCLNNWYSRNACLAAFFKLC